jgi:release factor glutamine methyltransferase
MTTDQSQLNPNAENKKAEVQQPSTTGQVWTIKDILKWSTDFLTAQECSDSPRLDVELLLSEVLSCSRISLYTEFDRVLSDGERQDFKKLLLRRKESEPVAYILGKKKFYNLEFDVTQDVLIPRNDTETLVESCFDFLNGDCKKKEAVSILDLGTGSGCIAISLAHQLSQATVTAVDISDEAIKVATKNSEKLGVSNISFSVGDMLQEDFWADLSTYDLIVANPPYISESEKKDMGDSVLRYEPHQALFAEEGGFIFYKMLSKLAKQHLLEGGRIFLEVGYLQAAQVAKIFQEAGWNDVQVRQDYGGHDRVVLAQL